MLGYLTLIFSCQLIGELIVAATGLPVPGPVIGMALLFAGLSIWGSLPTELAGVADHLLANLSLLFVPAGVGVMLHLSLLGRELVSISVALVASTVITVAVTALLMSKLSEMADKPTVDEDKPDGDAA
ncbi:MAG: CidA/LrgA family protein [Filomicrobium sp.]